MDFINLPILLFCILFGVSILTSLLSTRIGIPLILIFLCIGLFIGEAGLSLLTDTPPPQTAFFIGSVALALILFDSGFQTRLKGYRHVFLPSFLLATLGVILTAVILTPFAKEILTIGWIPALLLASIVSSTDSAAVFFLLRSQGISIREKVKSTLEVESGANDPMAIFLTLSLTLIALSVGQGQPFHFGTFARVFFMQFALGGGCGVLLGWTMVKLMHKLKLEPALYPILIVSMALGGFAITNMCGGSGFLAVYFAGLILGNAKIQAHTQITKFQQTLTWFSQITLFITLGLFVTADTLKSAVLYGFLTGCALIFIARPITVFSLLSFFKTYTFREKLFISAVGLRGATSILLALAPLVYQFGYADMFFGTVFIMVLFSLAFQGFLLPSLAKWCRLEVPLLNKPPEKMQIDLPGLTDSSLIAYDLVETTPAVIGEKIPKWAKPVLLIRNDISYSVSDIRKLKAGDKVYVFSYTDARQKMLDILYGGGQMQYASDALGDFPIASTTTFADIGKTYGIKIPRSLRNFVILDFIQSSNDDFEIGDRLSLSGVDIVIRAVENCQPTEIGLDIDPTRQHSFFTRIQSIS